MICSVLEMRPKPGLNGDIVEHFQAERIFERALAVEGCHDVQLLEQDGQILVLAWWKDAAAYQVWVDHPQRHQGRDRLNDLLVEPVTTSTVGGVFSVALHGSGSRA